MGLVYVIGQYQVVEMQQSAALFCILLFGYLAQYTMFYRAELCDLNKMFSTAIRLRGIYGCAAPWILQSTSHLGGSGDDVCVSMGYGSGTVCCILVYHHALDRCALLRLVVTDVARMTCCYNRHKMLCECVPTDYTKMLLNIVSRTVRTTAITAVASISTVSNSM